MDLNVARDMTGPGNERAVMARGGLRRIELGSNGGDVVEFPNLGVGPYRESARFPGKSHRLIEPAEMGVEDGPAIRLRFGPEQNELSGLVSCDREGHTKTIKNLRDGVRVNAAKRGFG